jgi:hypothetical protein
MLKKKSTLNYIINLFFFFTGLSIGVILIWPGILKIENRKCFLKIIKDGSDGKVTIGTIFSIEPNYLLKIKSEDNMYIKILLVGDQCFRK